jgi:hypothetical protein
MTGGGETGCGMTQACVPLSHVIYGRAQMLRGMADGSGMLPDCVGRIGKVMVVWRNRIGDRMNKVGKMVDHGVLLWDGRRQA